MGIKLWVDDIREAPTGWVWAKNYDEAISFLRVCNVIQVSLDHDLGKGKTGYDIVCWLEAHVFDGTITNPKIKCHSANPVGRERIEQVITKLETLK